MKPSDEERNYEIGLIEKACADSEPDKRALAKSELLGYLYKNYLGFLINCTRKFEDDLHKIKLPDSHEDTCRDFIAWVIEKDKLCKWGKTGLKKSLNTMLKNYLTDTMRSYCSIEYEIDAEGKKIKDEYGDDKVKKTKTIRPNLTMGEKLSRPIDDSYVEVEHPDLYKGIKHDSQEREEIKKLMLKKLMIVQKNALLKLQKIAARDADIINMETQGFSRSEMAKKLNIAESGINKIFGRALVKYAIIYHRTLKEEGIETNIPPKELSKHLHDVILD